MKTYTRLAVAGMLAVAGFGLLDVLLTLSWYLERITVVTHSPPEPLILYVPGALIDLLIPMRYALTLTGWAWLLATVAGVAAFLGWLRRARRGSGLRSLTELDEFGAGWSAPAPIRRWLWCLAVAVVLGAAGIVLRTAVVDFTIGTERMRALQNLAFLLWIGGATALIVATVYGVRTIRAVSRGIP